MSDATQTASAALESAPHSAATTDAAIATVIIRCSVQVGIPVGRVGGSAPMTKQHLGSWDAPDLGASDSAKESDAAPMPTVSTLAQTARARSDNPVFRNPAPCSDPQEVQTLLCVSMAYAFPNSALAPVVGEINRSK